MATDERDVQTEIRRALAGHAAIYRANVGTGWTGDVKRHGDLVVISSPRPLSTGLPAGFADLFGWRPLRIEDRHVGTHVAQFVAVEVKGAQGRASTDQRAFLAAVQRDGGVGIVARSGAEAVGALGIGADLAESAVAVPVLVSWMARRAWTPADVSRELGVPLPTVIGWLGGSVAAPRWLAYVVAH